MSEKDILKEMMQQAFQNETAPVRSGMFEAVQAKMLANSVASSTVATKGISLVSKWIIGLSAAAVVGTTTVVLMPDTNETTRKTDKLSVSSNELTKIEREASNEAEQVSVDKNATMFISKNEEKELIDIQEDDYNHPSSFEQPLFIVSDKKTEPNLAATNIASNGEDKKVDNETVKSITTENLEIKTPVVLESRVTEFPNVFTPNNDGANDLYEVKIKGVREFTLQIFDQNNLKMFETNDLNQSWDGRFNGEQVQPGMFFVLVVGKDTEGKSFRDKQLFELIR